MELSRVLLKMSATKSKKTLWPIYIRKKRLQMKTFKGKLLMHVRLACNDSSETPARSLLWFKRTGQQYYTGQHYHTARPRWEHRTGTQIVHWGDYSLWVNQYAATCTCTIGIIVIQIVAALSTTDLCNQTMTVTYILWKMILSAIKRILSPNRCWSSLKYSQLLKYVSTL
jgi:hypothetical protein